MSNLQPILRKFQNAGFTSALVVAVALLDVIPASAQFFGGPPQRQLPSNGGFGGGGWFGGDLFAPFQETPRPYLRRRQAPKRAQAPRPMPKPAAVDFSKAPLPEKRGAAKHKILVLGDSMADWLAAGLEDAYADQPDMGVLREIKTGSGVLKYQPQGEPADWIVAGKRILAAAKPDVIVIMLGLNDRTSIEEGPSGKLRKKSDEKNDAVDLNKQRGGVQSPATDPGQKEDVATLQEDPEWPQSDGDDNSPTPRSENSTALPSGRVAFRDERWVDLYKKKIEKLMGLMKAKGVPVVWVGLPAIRGTKATSDISFLNSLYHDAAARSDVTYVDVWEGFVDEGGRFLSKGPDFEGQTRQLRTSDGVYFTTSGARKLAHYVEREVTRILAARSAPMALPVEPATPGPLALPGQPLPRPLAGPILPLVESSVVTDQLLGGPDGRPAAPESLAARTLVKGEALVPPAGRADDFAWPRREVGEQSREGTTAVQGSIAKTATTARER